MATNRITLAQRERMFQVYSETGSVSRVAKRCSVHKKTVKRYKILDNWDERRLVIESSVQERADEKRVGRRLRNVRALDKAIEVITENLEVGGEIENKMLPKLIATQEVLLGRGAADDEVPDMTPEQLAAIELLKALPPGGLEALAELLVSSAPDPEPQALMIEADVEVIDTRNKRKRKPKAGKGEGRPENPMHLKAS